MSAIKLASDALIGTPAGGNIEYNGQFFATDSNNARAQLGRLVVETAKTATGTSVDFTGIPSWVKRITVMFNGVSTSGTSPIIIQLGDSGGVETTGYLGATSGIAGIVGTVSYTTGFGVSISNASTVITHGNITLTQIESSTNLWVCSGVTARSDTAFTNVTSGSKSLSATLDRIRITTVNGTDTFDAGSINILYEG